MARTSVIGIQPSPAQPDRAKTHGPRQPRPPALALAPAPAASSADSAFIVPYRDIDERAQPPSVRTRNRWQTKCVLEGVVGGRCEWSVAVTVSGSVSVSVSSIRESGSGWLCICTAGAGVNCKTYYSMSPREYHLPLTGSFATSGSFSLLYYCSAAPSQRLRPTIPLARSLLVQLSKFVGRTG
jgi:hypothetical protein